MATESDKRRPPRLIEQRVLLKIGSFLRVTRFSIRKPPLNPADERFDAPDQWKELQPLVDVFRRDSVAGLLHFIDPDQPDDSPERHVLFFVRQFRLSTMINAQTGQLDFRRDGVILELMAGSCEPGEPPLETFRREAIEETRITLSSSDIEHIASFYPSPGACSEQIHLYYAQVKQLPEGGDFWGFDEDEDIERVRMTAREFLAQVEAGEIMDGKALAAAEWMRRNADRFQNTIAGSRNQGS